MKKLLLNAALLLATAAPAFGAEWAAGSELAPSEELASTLYSETGTHYTFQQPDGELKVRVVSTEKLALEKLLKRLHELRTYPSDFMPFDEDGILQRLHDNPKPFMKDLVRVHTSTNLADKTWAITMAKELFNLSFYNGFVKQLGVLLHIWGETDFVVDAVVKARHQGNVGLLRAIGRDDAVTLLYEGILDYRLTLCDWSAEAAEHLLTIPGNEDRVIHALSHQGWGYSEESFTQRVATYSKTLGLKITLSVLKAKLAVEEARGVDTTALGFRHLDFLRTQIEHLQRRIDIDRAVQWRRAVESEA